MNLKNRAVKFILSSIIVFSFTFGSLAPNAQDLVPNEDLSLGASVFVFRKSRTNPQFKSTTAKYYLRNPSATASRRKIGKIVVVAKNRKRASGNPTLTAGNRNVKRKTPPTGIKTSQTLTAKADVLLENKETDKAIETYKNALKSNPQNGDAKSGLSEAYIVKGDESIAAGRRDEAVTFYRQASESDEKNYAAYAKIGQAKEDLKLNDDALASYQKALQINPAAPELFIRVANLFYKKDDLASADTFLKKAEANSPDDAEAIFLRGLLFYKRGENEKALAAFEKTLALDPEFLEAYLYQAEVYERLNKKDEAIAAYRKTVEINPQFVQGWFDLGVSNYNQGNYTEAETAYLKVIELDSENPAAHANLASVYRQMEKFAEANGEYKLASLQIKDDPDLFSEWGYCLGKVSDWEKAIARLQTAKDLSPDTIDYTNLGWGYYNAAQQDIEADKKDEGQAKLALGKTVLQKAVEINPKFDAAQLNLGITYTGLGEYQNAVETLTKANSLHRNWKIGLNELGIAYRKLNKLSDAINQFQKAVDLDNSFALGLYNLGEAQSKLGRKKAAKETLNKLKPINPELARKLDNVIKGVIIDETKQKIRSKIPRLPF
jgi:tetratricopeptide (TPR) repeat protein